MPYVLCQKNEAFTELTRKKPRKKIEKENWPRIFFFLLRGWFIPTEAAEFLLSQSECPFSSVFRSRAGPPMPQTANSCPWGQRIGRHKSHLNFGFEAWFAFNLPSISFSRPFPNYLMFPFPPFVCICIFVCASFYRSMSASLCRWLTGGRSLFHSIVLPLSFSFSLFFLQYVLLTLFTFL